LTNIALCRLKSDEDDQQQTGLYHQPYHNPGDLKTIVNNIKGTVVPRNGF